MISWNEMTWWQKLLHAHDKQELKTDQIIEVEPATAYAPVRKLLTGSHHTIVCRTCGKDLSYTYNFNFVQEVR